MCSGSLPYATKIVEHNERTAKIYCLRDIVTALKVRGPNAGNIYESRYKYFQSNTRDQNNVLVRIMDMIN
jgi:hypothetical protein